MSAQHTPGPWEVGAPLADGTLTVVVPCADSTGFIVAHVSPISTGWSMRGLQGRAADNARAIASVPDLLAALEDIWREAHYGAKPECGFRRMPPALREAILTSRAAIAKATGSAA